MLDLCDGDSKGQPAGAQAGVRFAQCLATLLIAGALIAIEGCAPLRPLSAAAARGDTVAIEKLLAAGEPIDDLSGGSTPLMRAAIAGRVGAVEKLLKSGASVAPIGAGGQSALHQVVFGPEPINKEVVRLLLEYGADPELPDETSSRQVPIEAFRRPPSFFYSMRKIGTAAELAEIRKMMEAQVARRKEMSGDVSQVKLPQPGAPRRIAPAFSVPERPNDFAVLIGIENYNDLPSATNAERDAVAAKDFVRALGVPERNITLLTGNRATRTGLVKNLETWLANNATEKSRVFVYYSGHGAPDPKTGDAYLVPSDGDPQYLTDTGYPLKRLYDSLARLKANQVIVMLDSCFSGAGGRSVLPKGTRPLVATVENMPKPVPTGANKLIVLAASAGNQISGSDDSAGYGLFTKHLLDGLNSAVDAGGRLSVRALFDYLSPRVQDDAKRANREQSPQLAADSPESVLLR